MRTSPLPVRPRPSRRVLGLLLVGALALAGTACSDDGPEQTTPTTTSPASAGGSSTTTTADGDDGTTGTTDATTTTAAGPDASTTVPGDEADVLTATEAEAQLQSLLGIYRSLLIDARASGAVDEATASRLANVYSGRETGPQLQALTDLGPDAVAPNPPALAVSDVEVLDATGTCAAGSAVVTGVQQLFVNPVKDQQPYYFRLVPAAEGAASPGWRIDLFNFSTAGTPPEGASCT